MVSTLSPDRVILVGALALYSWARHLTLTVPLSTQVYKWLPANLMLEETCNGLAYHPGGSRNTPGLFMLQKPGYAPNKWAIWLIYRPHLALASLGGATMGD